jgi:hypothetical protein
MKLGQKLLVKPSKLTRKLKLENWDTEYNAHRKKENVEHELDRLSWQMSELQYKLFRKPNLFSLYFKELMLQVKTEQFVM